jgi:DNA-binding NarL/FixJ family response regulator
LVEPDGRLRAALIELLAETCILAIVMSDPDAVIRHFAGCLDDQRSPGPITVVVADPEVEAGTTGRSGLGILATVRRRGWPVQVVLTARPPTSRLRGEAARLGAAGLLVRPASKDDWRAALQAVIGS